MAEIKKIEEEYNELIDQLSDPGLISNWEKFEEISRRKKKLEKIIEAIKELEKIQAQIKENQAILNSPEDSELTSLAEAEIDQLRKKETTQESQLDSLMKDKDSIEEPCAAIIEIRAGTGGDEAALFAESLYNMYSRYAVSQKWKQKILESHPTELGGIKEIVFEINGEQVFSKMKHEAGVHRVQRIPSTEKAGRIHTSTATVAILPKPGKTDVKFKTDEIKVDHYRSSGPGGQNVNKRETAVRITHLKTGIVVTSQAERNQLQNKENALKILSAKLLEKKQEEDALKLGGERKAQIGGAKRAEKIRTYNFPQDRVTDHRIKKTWHNIEEIMQGGLDKIAEELKEIED